MAIKITKTNAGILRLIIKTMAFALAAIAVLSMTQRLRVKAESQIPSDNYALAETHNR